jgi:predicted MPP superfamily phosphohydrolase
VRSALAVLVVWSISIEPRRLVVRRADLALPLWPATLDGLRVVVVSDLHAGGWHVDEAKLVAVVNAVNHERPAVVLLLGDFVQPAVGTAVAPERIAAILRDLRAPLGVFAVLGNHDWWWNGERIWRALEGAGIRVLESSAAEVRGGAAPFWVAGSGDYMTRAADPDVPLREVPAHAPVLLATHNPDVFPRVSSRVSLTLAGHTHGGQVRLPFVGAPVVPSAHGQRYAHGHVVEGGRHLYVTTGIGTSILPVRLGVPPEIVVLTLRSAGP